MTAAFSGRTWAQQSLKDTNFDIRTDANAASVAYRQRLAALPSLVNPAEIANARAAGLKRLRADFSGIDVVESRELTTTEVMSFKPGLGFLTGPSADRVGAMRKFLSKYADAYGLSYEQVGSLVLVADYINPAGNMTWVEFEQRINGLPVFRGLIRGGFTANGELARTTGQQATGLSPDALSQTPMLAAEQAVATAAAHVGWSVAVGALTQTGLDVAGRVTFARGPKADEARAWLLYFPVGPGTARLAWATEIWGDPNAFLILLDAEDGTLLFRENLTDALQGDGRSSTSISVSPDGAIGTAQVTDRSGGKHTERVTSGTVKINRPLPSQATPQTNAGDGASTSAWQTILEETFEGLFPSGSWQVFDNNGSTGGFLYWDDVNCLAHAGSWSMWAAAGGGNALPCASTTYANSMDSWAVYGPFSLSDASDAFVDFQFNSVSELNFDNFSWMASTNGVNFYGTAVSGSFPGWNFRSFDLKNVPTLGNVTGRPQVWIAFTFTSDISVTSGRGPFVDDVVIRKNTNAQTGDLGGMVVSNVNTSVGIVGATVSLQGTSFSTTTDSIGRYLLSNVPAGTYTMQVSRGGFQSFSGSATVVPLASTVKDVTLSSLVILNVASSSVSPPTGSTGSSTPLSITYSITNNSGSTQNVLLGATLSGPIEFSDSANDVFRSVATGTNVYTRSFIVPASAPAGTYNMLLGLWGTRNADGSLKSLLASGTKTSAFTNTTTVPDIRIVPTSLSFVREVTRPIYVELDWMEDDTHSHRPSQAVIDTIVQTFAREGFTINIDVSNAIPHQAVLAITGSPSGSPSVQALKAAYFNHAADSRYFYSIWAHNYSNDGQFTTSSGIADLPGNTHLVSLGSFANQVGTASNQAGTFVHEFGHNLGQFHGGVDSQNYKPNYLSIMNYFYQLNGIGPSLVALQFANTTSGFNTFGYSHGLLPNLNESDLNENLGIGLGRARDWNCDGILSTSLARDIQAANPCSGAGGLSVLADYDNWAAINAFVQTGAAAPQATSESSVICVTPEDDLPIRTAIDALRASRLLPDESALMAPPNSDIVPLGAAAHFFDVFNDGATPLNVTGISLDTPAAWVAWEPQTFSVAPGGSQRVQVYVNRATMPAGQTTRRLLVTSNDPDESPYPNAINLTMDGGAGQYLLSVTKVGSGSGTVTSNPVGVTCGADCSETYSSGTVVTLTATAAAGSTFPGWSGDADCSDGVVTMSGARSCTATFNLVTYALSVTKAGSGSGTVSSNPAGINCGADCAEAYGSGTSVTLTATSSSGSKFAGWSGTGSGSYSGTNNPAMVTMNAPITETARFTQAFTDDPLVPGTTEIKAVHITELRSRTDAVRVAKGLAPYSWTDPSLTPTSTVLKAQHIIDLRTALSEAYVAAGLTSPTFTDPVLTGGVTAKVIHIEELRAVLIAIE